MNAKYPDQSTKDTYHENKTPKARFPANDSARSGLDKLKTNADGSVDLYFGPAGSAPAGLEANWIETLPGKGFYPLFRVYYPKPGLFDGTWKLPDVELMK